VANTRWLFWIAVAAFLWLMVSHLTEIETATLPLIRGQPEWILLAAVLQVLYYTVFAAIFKSAFYTVDIKSRILDILPVTLGALFINVVAPTWGMAGAALYVDDASHRGESPARAAAGTLLAQTADFKRLCSHPGWQHSLPLHAKIGSKTMRSPERPFWL